MKEVSNGAFALVNYKISKFSLIQTESENTDLSVLFEPSGVFSETKNIYTLKFNFTANFGKNVKTEFISTTVEAVFKFAENIKQNEIPSYFYVNSIAIVFPHLRAFITTLTAVANLTPLILPILNLTFLAEELKEKTLFVE